MQIVHAGQECFSIVFFFIKIKNVRLFPALLTVNFVTA